MTKTSAAPDSVAELNTALSWENRLAFWQAGVKCHDPGTEQQMKRYIQRLDGEASALRIRCQIASQAEGTPGYLGATVERLDEERAEIEGKIGILRDLLMAFRPVSNDARAFADEGKKAAMRASVIETVWTLRHMDAGPGAIPSQYRSWWPDILHTRQEAYGWADATVTRQKPTARQLSKMDQMLPLLFKLPLRERKACMLKAIPLGWRRVANELGCSHMSAKRWEDEAISKLVYLAANDIKST